MAEPWDALAAGIKFAITETDDQDFTDVDLGRDFWADLIAKAIYQNGGVPTGAIQGMGVAGGSTVDGWLYCDGVSYLRATFQDLYNLIGNAFGTADGTHFNVPDLRGQFLRGEADGEITDPDRAGRITMATGGNSGDAVGSIQADELRNHQHNVFGNVNAASGAARRSLVLGAGNDGLTATDGGGSETRPVNAYVSYYIKT